MELRIQARGFGDFGVASQTCLEMVVTVLPLKVYREGLIKSLLRVVPVRSRVVTHWFLTLNQLFRFVSFDIGHA